MMENTVVGMEDVVGGGRDERTERGRRCFFPRVVLAEVEESGKKNSMLREYSKFSVLQPSNGYTCYLCCKKKKSVFYKVTHRRRPI